MTYLTGEYFVESVGQFRARDGQRYPFLPIDGSGHLDMAGLGFQIESHGHVNDLSRYIDNLSIKVSQVIPRF